MQQKLISALLLLLCAACVVPNSTPNSTPPSQLLAVNPAYSVQYLQLPGPLRAVLVKVDLKQPKVQVEVALANPDDPDGDGPSVGQLDFPSHVARQHDYAITLNASFFATPIATTPDGRKLSYFAGNGGYPVGWHYSGDRLVSAPTKDSLRASLVVDRDGKLSLHRQLMRMPARTQFAVSGNAMVLEHGVITTTDQGTRHPRSSVGLSADAKTLYLLAIDGRAADYSIGASLWEVAKIMQEAGAHDAINLDGGGSTAMIIKDPTSGKYVVANRPSDRAGVDVSAANERAVIDVIGVRLQ